jgi:hypothetical protein
MIDRPEERENPTNTGLRCFATAVSGVLIEKRVYTPPGRGLFAEEETVAGSNTRRAFIASKSRACCATGTPAWALLKNPTVCSSKKRPFLIPILLGS